MRSSSVKHDNSEHHSACALEVQYQSSFFQDGEDDEGGFEVGFGVAFAIGLSVSF